MVSLLHYVTSIFMEIFQCLISWLSSSHFFSFQINDLQYKLSKILWPFWESGNPVFQEFWKLTAEVPPSPWTWGLNFYALSTFSSISLWYIYPQALQVVWFLWNVQCWIVNRCPQWGDPAWHKFRKMSHGSCPPCAFRSTCPASAVPSYPARPGRQGGDSPAGHWPRAESSAKCGTETHVFLDVRHKGGKSSRLGRRPGLGFLCTDLINMLEWLLCTSPWLLRLKEWMRSSSFLPVVHRRQTQKKARPLLEVKCKVLWNTQKPWGNDATVETSWVKSN